jgi:hypothetical protein
MVALIQAVIADDYARGLPMNWGDIPAWVALVVALFALAVAVWSAATARKSLYWERLSAEAASRSAEAAERANLLAERSVNEGRKLSATSSDHYDPGDQLDINWRIEHPGENRYVLRNTGTDIAEHVEVDRAQAGPVNRNLPRDAVIRPGEGVDMLIAGTWGSPIPNQLYVRWGGQPDWVAVPIS